MLIRLSIWWHKRKFREATKLVDMLRRELRAFADRNRIPPSIVLEDLQRAYDIRHRAVSALRRLGVDEPWK